MNKTRILIVDDHPLMREALVNALSDEAEMEVVGEASNGLDAITAAKTLHPDVVLLDLFMPVMGGLDAIGELLKNQPDLHIVILTSATDETMVQRALQAGALGYILKDSRRVDILQAIRSVSQGYTYLPGSLARKLFSVKPPTSSNSLSGPLALPEANLTAREKEILELIGGGASNAEIASHLVLSESTVRTHVHNLLGKLGLANRNQLILFTLKHQ